MDLAIQRSVAGEPHLHSSGPVGSGKSTIAHTIAQTFHEQRRLGAVIFLHEDVIGANAQALSSSIVEQLARYDPQLRAGIADKIKSDKSLASADIGRQFPGLIVETTSSIDADCEFMMIGPVLILIDGLDVIEDREQHKVLNIIADYSQKLPSNFRILITCRPGDMVERTLGPLSYSQIHDIGFDNPDDHRLDLAQYVSQHTIDLLSQKPGIADRWIQELETQFNIRAMGMHFWVSIASRALLESSDDDASLILVDLFSNRMPHSKEETLDHLYRAILRTPSIHLHYPIAPWIIFDILIKSPRPMSISELHHTTCIPDDVVATPMNDIFSWLQKLGLVIKRLEDEQGVALYGINPSLEDFLTNPRRCSGAEVYVDRETPQISPAEICLDVMNRLLRHNICNVEDLMSLNSEIEDLDKRIQMFIPSILEYPCYTWIHHIQNLGAGLVLSLHRRIQTFLLVYLLHWIEAMSISIESTQTCIAF